MEHAFSYRKSLQPNCQCKPSPWADSEIARHRQYAADERALSPQFATLDQATPVSSPVEDAAPIPDTDVQSDAVAAGIAPAAPELRAAASESVIGADGTEPAYADPLPVALQGLPKAKRSKSGQGRAKSAAPPFAGGPIPWLMFNPSSFGVQTVDRDRHR